MLTSLPVPSISSLLSVFDVAFNLVYKILKTTNQNVGAFAMFGVTPANLLVNSPYLAKIDSTSYSFPGHPVSMKHLKIRLRNTTKASEFSGRWAAVFIPYREEHDSTHYEKILADLSFTETVAMPYAQSDTADKDLVISYRMRDRSAYCARPREITEEIGIIYVIWDIGSRDSFTDKLTNSSFNCEIELQGGCIPHEIFGPGHRVQFASDKFKIRSVTTGELARVHYPDGTVRHLRLSDLKTEQSFEMI